MSNLTIALIAVMLPIVVCASAQELQGVYHESFESGIPDYFTATRPDSLSVSPWHYKEGTGSLQWDWHAGEELLIRHGIGDVERVGGYRCKAAFSVWLYMEEPLADALVFEFREGETVTGSFKFPLGFTGWRQARPYYSAFPEGKPTSAVDTIRIAAPAAIEKGTVFIDFIKYNTLTYGGGDVVPETDSQWQPPVPDGQRFPKPETVTEAQVAGIRKLLGPDQGPGIEQATVDGLCKRVEALGIVRDEHGVRGPGLDAQYQYLCAPGQHGYKDIEYLTDENGPGWMGVQTPSAMSSLARQLASTYRASNDPDQRARLREAYLLVTDHVQDQVMQAGSGFVWNWWVGGNWADAVFLMRDVLAETGRLQARVDYLLYTYGAGAIFAEGKAPSNMDFYNLTVPRLFHLCLLQVEPAEQVRWLNAFRAMMELSMLQPTSALKIDGSAYHHGGHYHSYARGAFGSLPRLIRDLNGTPWRLSTEAHERLRRAMLAQRLYANRLDLPIALKGRSPFAPGYGTINPGDMHALGVLALCGTPDGTQEVDAEVAAAHLRFLPEKATEEPYLSLGIKPEPEPEGTFVMPYAGLLCHRRDDWLATVRGQSKYVWGSERQAQRNCFGAFQSLGSLQILAGGTPVTAEASGTKQPGWDWRRFEGITVPQVPIREIDQLWKSRGQVFSPETFVGGVSYQGRQGMFAMILNQPMPDGQTITGRKSWFLHDDQVLCLGSDISCGDARYPTQTTLCQKALTADEQGALPPTIVDGTEMTAFPNERMLEPSGPHWFIDTQQTGYWLPPGQDITVARTHQTSRDFYDSEETEGDFLAAWINHGTAPDNAGYEYLAVVRATPDVLAGLEARQPYQVFQRDAAAHIVRHTGGCLWGCAFFTPQEVARHTEGADTLPVAAVDRPCLIMAANAPDGDLALSVADPDLNLVDGANQPQPLRVTLRGAWRLLDVTETVCAWPLGEEPPEVHIVSSDAEETVLEIVCRHGAIYDIDLGR